MIRRRRTKFVKDITKKKKKKNSDGIKKIVEPWNRYVEVEGYYVEK
jgi:hypothetical protein